MTNHGVCRPVVLQLTLPPDLAHVRPASQEVTSFLATEGCNEGELTAFSLALVEACNNAIRYAPHGSDQPVDIEVQVSGEHIEVRITDHTLGFDWPEKSTLPPADSESGRGLYLIRSLTDRAGYLRGQGKNILHFSRRRATPVSPPIGQETGAGSEQVIAQLSEELGSCYESLSAIFRHSTAIHADGDLKHFADRLLHDLLEIVKAEWFLVRLESPDGAGLTVFAASEPALELGTLQLAAAEAPINCAEIEAALTRHQVWFDTRTPAGTIDPLARAKPDAQGLVHPFFSEGRLLGTLTVGRKPADPVPTNPTAPQASTVFTASQTSVIGTLADFLAMEVVNARHHEEQTRARVLAHELEIANNIQRSLLLKQMPRVPGIDIAGFCENARQVGGDFYDVLPVTGSSLLLIIADVMGKGVPAAMFAAILRTALRASPDLLHQPAALLTRANSLLFEELSGVDMFITAQLVLIDSHERKLTIASAGHCPMLLTSSASPELAFASLTTDGIPLGIQSDALYEARTVELGKSFRALLYTDGLTEAVNEERGRYGQENIECWFAATAAQCRTADELKSALIAEVKQFRGQMPLADDQTFLAITNTPAS